ncbi:MAG: ABC transporter substrate-binding protein [Gammaproteobacteria bacterium]|nr:ABC transporter substrate-binding protein [Gammaproteobacteria bacterium]
MGGAHADQFQFAGRDRRLRHTAALRVLAYERVEDYWGRDIPAARGRYNLDVLRYEVYRDATVVREALRKGLIDAWTERDFRYWHSAYDTPALEKGWLKKIRRNFGIEIGMRRIITFNLRRAQFADRRVRRALTLAMDFEWWKPDPAVRLCGARAQLLAGHGACGRWPSRHG